MKLVTGLTLALLCAGTCALLKRLDSAEFLGVSDYLPRLGRMLAVTDPEVADVDMTGWDRARDYLGEQPGRALEAWRQDRDRLIGLLARLGPADWVRVGIHSVRGPFPLATMVRAWVEHDLSHRRQITLALGAL